MEEKLDEATQEPATTMTADDWTVAKRRLEEKISKGQLKITSSFTEAMRKR